MSNPRRWSDPDRMTSSLVTSTRREPRPRRRAHQQRRRQQDGVPDLPGRHVQRPDRHRHRRRRPDAGQDGRALLRRHRPAHLRQRLRQPGRRPRADLPGLRRQRQPARLHRRRLHERRQGGRSRPSCAPRPSNAPQPADAPRPARPARSACSSTARPVPRSTAFTAGPAWSAAATRSRAATRPPATTPGTPPTRRATTHQPARLWRRRSPCPPASRRTCGSSSGGCSTTRAATYYDGGTVEVDNTPTPYAAVRRVRRCPWVNGPTQNLAGDRNAGREGLRVRQPRLGGQPGRPLGASTARRCGRSSRCAAPGRWPRAGGSTTS